jgi:hypothetical protein
MLAHPHLGCPLSPGACLEGARLLYVCLIQDAYRSRYNQVMQRECEGKNKRSADATGQSVEVKST